MNKMKTFVFGLLLIGLISAGCLEASEDNSGGTFLEGEPGNLPDEDMAASTGMAVPDFDGSGVVEKIVIEASSSVEPSVVADVARAEIVPPVPTTSGSGSGIHVSGRGKVSSVPDVASLTAGVVTTGSTADEASQENAAAMDRVIKALKSLGIDEKDIRTQSVSVWPEYDYGYRDSGSREQPRIIGYRADNQVSVTLRDITLAGKAIDAAVGAGSNQVYGLSYGFSEDAQAALYAMALKKAVADGTGKAQAIADALGVERITPVGVSESGGYYPGVYRFDVAEAAAKDGSAVPTPVSPGELEVSATVSMSFDFA